ncbi:oxidoreductase [Apodospora peruviana]|uniref:Oxidoreductase n=1 Tax=Apodospora peruviana TaxID=516989 RepID=A0AAE0HZ37_9PEZI|nr:oxidoreductase [Apodospora peruviana]
MPGVDASNFPKIIPFTKKWHNVPYPFISPTRPELSAAGRNVVVTGGGTGIGNAIAVAFAQAGAKSVSILGRRLDRLQSGAATISAVAASSATQVFYEQADLFSRDETARALRSIVVKVGGTIDVMVSNAGPVMSDSFPTISEATDEQLEFAFRGLVMTAAHAIQAFLPLASPEAVLLSTNTCFAHWPAVAGGFGLYSLNRAAVLKLTDYVQAENPGLRVVSIQPGWVATEANGYQTEATDAADLPGQFYVWLASQEAGFLKGKFVWSNWDAEELVERAEEIKSTTVLTTGLLGVDG